VRDAAELTRLSDDLRRSRDRLRRALEAARMGIWEWDIASGALTWSRGLDVIHGMEPGTFDGTFQGFLDVVHPDDRDELQRAISASLESGCAFSTEFRAVGHDGRIRWVAGEGEMVADEAGRPVGMIGIGRDVTERRRAEEALRESEERFRRMADSAPVLIWVADTEGRRTYINAVWLRFTGRPLERELGRGWAEGIHPDDLERRLAVSREAFARREPFEAEYRLRRADGEYRWMLDHGVPRTGLDGAFEGFIGSCIDITDRREAERRDRLIADIGYLLDRPLSLEERLSELARTLLPEVADACVVDLIEEDGTLRRAAAAHVDAGYRRTMLDLPRPLPESPIGRVAATGEPTLIADVTDAHHQMSARDPGELEVRRSIGIRSAVVVPLVARGRRIGVLALSTSREHSDRRLDENDLRFAGRVAARAALAIDNARLFAAETAARRRTEFLAEASGVLTSSLEPRDTLQTLAGLVVPGLADWCTVHLVDERGALSRVALAHADPDRVRWAAELSDRYPPDADAPTGIAGVVRTGRSELVPRISDEMIAEAAEDDEHLRLLREVGLTSYLCVPLIARGTSIGALSLLDAAESGRQLGEADLRLAEDLAQRAASAIDNARLYRDQRAIAKTLQRALLPAGLPAVPGATVSSAYVAMGAGVEAGGDFYDVFEAPGGGRWLLVVGDVCGKGPEAAALTALARYTLRAIAPLDPSPASLLRGLNEAVRRQQPGSMQFLTACVGLMEREGDGLVVRVACAGHPPPAILRAGGEVSWASARGTLLGVQDATELHPDTVTLGPGDRLVLYTDGATEARRGAGGFLGEEGLADCIAGLATVPAAGAADALAARVRDWAGGSLRDDLAILVVARDGGAGG
jgi:PAS domain S-box-containing protein